MFGKIKTCLAQRSIRKSAMFGFKVTFFLVLTLTQFTKMRQIFSFLTVTWSHCKNLWELMHPLEKLLSPIITHSKMNWGRRVFFVWFCWICKSPDVDDFEIFFHLPLIIVWLSDQWQQAEREDGFLLYSFFSLLSKPGLNQRPPFHISHCSIDLLCLCKKRRVKKKFSIGKTPF